MADKFSYGNLSMLGLLDEGEVIRDGEYILQVGFYYYFSVYLFGCTRSELWHVEPFSRGSCSMWVQFPEQ